jgi:hypothetical protein
VGNYEWNQTRGRRKGMDLIGSRGETMIDYGIVNEEAWGGVEERVESGYLRLEIN